MQRSVWSTVALSALALSVGLTVPGCIGKRRPDGKQQAASGKARTTAPARLIQPGDVDGAYDSVVETLEGERVLATYDEQDPSRGAAIPLVTIVEYSDFQCPYCGRLAESLDDVLRDYDRDVKLVFKQFPLPMHAQAEPAARAALAAHEQGRFWEMHDLLFANSRALSDGQIEGYARKLGLNIEKFRKDYSAPDKAAHVKAEMAQGSPLGVRGTPTFFINGVRQSGMMTPEQLRGLIDTEILAAQKLLAAGVKREELYARLLHPLAAKAGDTGKDTAAAAAKKPAAKAKPKAAPDAKAKAKGFDGPRYPVTLGEDRPQRGPSDALVTIVEFGAFDCDDCRAIHGPLQRTLAKYPKDVRLVYRALATTPRARRPAQAVYAAHKQGKFWALYDALKTDGQDLTAVSAKALAAEKGLDAEAFAKDLRARGAGGPTELITEDRNALTNAGQPDEQAPVLYINGRRLAGAFDIATLDAIVREEKANAEAFLAANPTVDRNGLYRAMRKSWKRKAAAIELEAAAQAE